MTKIESVLRMISNYLCQTKVYMILGAMHEVLTECTVCIFLLSASSTPIAQYI